MLIYALNKRHNYIYQQKIEDMQPPAHSQDCILTATTLYCVCVCVKNIYVL